MILKTNNDMKARILAFITILIWASAFIVLKILLRNHNLTTISAIRFILTQIILLVFILIKKMKFPEKKDLFLFFISGITGFVFHILFLNFGLYQVNASTASIINASSPILNSLLAIFFLRENTNKKFWFSIFISFLGILILTILGEGFFTINIGTFWLFLSSLSLAIYNITQKKITQKYNYLESSIFSLFFGSFFWTLYTPKIIKEIKVINFIDIILIFYLTLFVGIISFVLWGKAIAVVTNTNNITVFLFFSPIFSTIMGIWFLNEKLTIFTLIGGLFSLIGIIGCNKFKNK